MTKFLTLSLLGAALTASTAFGAIITTYSGVNAQTNFNNSLIVGGAPTVTEDFNTNDSLFTTFDIQGTNNGVAPGFGGGQRLSRVTPTYSELVTLDGGNMVAFGGTWDFVPFSGLGAGLRLTIALVGGGTQVITPILGYDVTGSGGTPNLFFFGFTSDVAFSSVTISQAGQNGVNTEGFNLDNLLVEQSGGAPPPPPPPPGVPEPSTFGLMGLAMVGIGAVRRFRR